MNSATNVAATSDRTAIRLERPDRIGPYQVESALGEGAMGVVYKGFDPNVKRYVALKTLRRELLGRDSERLLARLRLEAEAAGRLSHPGIVTVYGLIEHQSAPVVVMEFAEGRTLDELLQVNAGLGREQAVAIVAQLLEALAYAHSHNVVHRDIKPGNVIVLPDGKIKVMDFGVAKIERSDLTMLGEVMGTPNYMSPEQWLGEPVDHRSDIFAAGVVLYQALTGEKPFAADSIAATKSKALRVEPPPVSTLNPRLGTAFDALVRKALAKNADDRYRSAREFLDSLREANAAPDCAATEATVRYGGARGSQPRTTTPALRRTRYLAVAVLAIAVGAGTWFINGASGPVTGSLTVASDPPGATLLLDGSKLLGVTPTHLELPPGEHHLSLKKDGFYDWEASVEVQAQVETPLAVSLNALK